MEEKNMNSDYGFSLALKFTLEQEGGYVDNPSDPGGATNFGVTQKTYDAYREELKLPLQRVAHISDTDVKAIYKNLYWEKANCNLLSYRLGIVQFDTAVNFGVAGAIKFLQEALGVDQDGVWGEAAQKALLDKDHYTVALNIVRNRIEYRYKRVEENESQRIFLSGWINRDVALKKYILNI